MSKPADHGWLEIGSAPKDRFVLLRIVFSDGEVRWEIGKYDAGAEQRASGDYGPFVWGSQESGYGIWARDVVTHWQELPPLGEA